MFASNLFFGAAEAASGLAGSAAGSTHMWIGVAIFAAAYLFIASEKVDKTIAAMLGAGLPIIRNCLWVWAIRCSSRSFPPCSGC